VGFLVWKSTQVGTATVPPNGLEISGGLTSSTIPFDELRLHRARVVTLSSERALQPVDRIAGTSISNYLAGWFRLRNGEKALLVIHKTDRVLYIPTRRDHSLLVGVGDPDALLEDLRAERGLQKGGQVQINVRAPSQFVPVPLSVPRARPYGHTGILEIDSSNHVWHGW
jgi:hypothetical protein